MTHFVAFLRGINVGGNNKINMKELAELFVKLGYHDVQTYLNSGNVLFVSDEKSNEVHAKKIEDALLEKFGLKIRVMIKTKAELEFARDANPFKNEKYGDEATLFVSFLFNSATDTDRETIKSWSSDHEKISATKHEVYTLLFREAFPKSSMGKSWLLNKLKLDSTARNWNTLNNVIERMS